MDKNAYHHGDLRRALLDETLAVLEEGGMDELSLRKLAQRVGVSRGAPYHHFANKDALLAAAISEGFGIMLARTQDQVSAGADPFDALRACGRVYLAFALERPALYRLMMGSVVKDKSRFDGLVTCATEYYDHLRGLLARCVQTGETHHDDVEVAAFTVWASVHGLASLLLDGAMRRSPSSLSDDGSSAEHEAAMQAHLIDEMLDTIGRGLRRPVSA